MNECGYQNPTAWLATGLSRAAAPTAAPPIWHFSALTSVQMAAAHNARAKGEGQEQKEKEKKKKKNK